MVALDWRRYNVLYKLTISQKRKVFGYVDDIRWLCCKILGYFHAKQSVLVGLR